MSNINWSRGTRWEGVRGKVRPNGVFPTAGGVKDSARASYRALVWSDEVGPDRGAVWRESYRLNAGRLMSKEFVERRDGSFYLIGSRVPLAHIVREFRRGASPEALRSHYPALSLEEVYGAITFYLGSQEDVEGDALEREREEDAFTAAHPTPPEVRTAFERMRQQTVSRRS